jgi:hypothetical protein
MSSIDENHKKTRQCAFREYRVTVDRDPKGKESGRESKSPAE